MSGKIDIRDIFSDHFSTLYNAGTKKLSLLDFATFFIIPILIGILSVCLGIEISLAAVGILVGALSVLAGFLINVLVLLYTVKDIGPTEGEKAEQRTVIKEVNSNLLFAITVSVFAILLLCVVRIAPDAFNVYISGVIVFVLANFLLTLMMALKRLKSLLNLRFK